MDPKDNASAAPAKKVNGVLCFNGPVQRDSAKNYYSNLLSEEFLAKYLEVCGTLTIATRIVDVAADLSSSRLHRVADSRIRFVSCPDYTSPQQVLKNTAKLRAALTEALTGADILFVRVSGSIAIQATKQAKKLGVPCLVEVVTCARDVYWNHSLKGKLVMPFMYGQMKKAVRGADYVQYITTQFLQKRYPTNGKSYVCSNALTEPMSAEQFEQRLAKYEGDIKTRTIHLATTATLTVAYKGQRDIIRALPLLKQRGYDVVYHLIGDGDASQLRAIAAECGVQDRVDFVGQLKHSDVHAFLDGMDIYVQPSWAEAQGRSLIEALSRGLPCACANVGGMVELLEPEYIFKKKNPQSAADALERLLKADLRQVAERNYKKSFEFEKQKLIAQRREIFTEVALNGK